MGLFKKGENWFIDYYRGGHRKREKIGPSKSLAKEVLIKRQNEVSEGKYFPERRKSIFFHVFADKYWNLEGIHLKAKGIRGVLNTFKIQFENKTLSEITSADVQNYYNITVDRTSAATANRQINFLSPMFNRAKEWGDFYGENPVAKVRRRKEENRRLRFLSEEEIKNLLGIADTRLRPLLACAILTGMRKGEMLGLRWENLDLEHGTIFILKSKSGKAREIPIGKRLEEIFLSLGPRAQGSVFNLPEITMRRHFARALENANIQGFRFHDLRHTFASHFVMRTGDLPALQKLLGHSSPQMTQRYAHLAKEHLFAKMEKFESSMPIESVNLARDGHSMDTSSKIEIPENAEKSL